MSFVSELRMRNMFPVHSNMGTAQIDLSGPDPMEEIIQRALQLRGTQQPRETGLQQVAQQQQQNTGDTNIGIGGRRLQPGSTLEEPLVFGGVRGEQSNPGADILRRATGNAERLYNSYSQTAPAPKGPSNDEQHLEAYFKRQNEEKRADATLAATGSRGWKVGNVIGPDGTPISVRYNEQTGETEPLDAGGTLVNKETPGAIQKRADAEQAKAESKKNYLSKTNESLTVIKDLMDDAGKLTAEGKRAVGKSSIGNWIPTTMGYTGQAKINKLKSEQVLNLIAELKAQSKTGATGMGNMSNKDLGVIERAASLLDTGLDEAEFEKQLKIVKDELNDIARRLNSPDTGGMKMATSRDGGNNAPLGAGAQGGKIKVRDKATGKVGTMSEGAFNPQKYDKVQ